MAKQKEKKVKAKYRGYDIGQDGTITSANRPWFWKVLLISLLLTVIIIIAVCAVLLYRKNENTKSLEEINTANTIKALMKGHDNVKIIRSWSHLTDNPDYKTTRQVSIGDSGDYYCYYKVEGSAADYKEVIDHGECYRDQDNFSYYYGLIGDDYEKKCVAGIEDDVVQLTTSDIIGDQNEGKDLTTLTLTYDVQGGDEYNLKYGFEAGTKIKKKVTYETESRLITSLSESVNDEVFYSYLVEFDSELKIPRFYRKIKQKKTMRTCHVVSSYNGENEKDYSYTFGIGIYFTVFDHEGYGIYQDKEGNIEYSGTNLLYQNPDSDLTLYVMPAAKQ